MLSDQEWAAIAADVMDRTGLSPHGQEDEAVRWVAVRHGDDHIHLVVMLARQDGGTPSLSFERYRVRAACLAAERCYGLRSTAPADRTAPRRPSRAESEKAARRGLGEAPRSTLRRHVTTAAAGAGSEAEFFTRLDRAGVLVRQRFSTKTPGQLTGYAVALPGDTAKDGGPVWYGGGKLAADLTWPKLRQRWTQPRPAPSGERLTAAEQKAIWEHAAHSRRGRHHTDQCPSRDEPGGGCGCRLGRQRHAARGRRRAGQPAPCARPLMPTTGPPAPPTAASRRPARPGTSSATPPGSSARSPTSPVIRRSCPWCSSPGWPRSVKPSPNCAASSSTPPKPLPPAPRPSCSTPPPVRPPPHHRRANPRARTAAQLADPILPPALPVRASQTPTRPAPPRTTAAGQDAGHPHHGHPAPAADSLVVQARPTAAGQGDRGPAGPISQQRASQVTASAPPLARLHAARLCPDFRRTRPRPVARTGPTQLGPARLGPARSRHVPQVPAQAARVANPANRERRSYSRSAQMRRHLG